MKTFRLPGRADEADPSPPAATCADLRAMLIEYGLRPVQQRNTVNLAARVEEVVTGYRACEANRRRAYRAWIRLYLDDTAEPVLPFALRLAARIAIPEARGQLLRLLTTLPATHAFCPVDLRPLPVRALGRFCDASLGPLFAALLRSASKQAVRYQAAWAMVCAAPATTRLAALPGDLSGDAQLLSDLLLTGLPGVRANVMEHLGAGPPEAGDALMNAPEIDVELRPVGPDCSAGLQRRPPRWR